MILTYIAGCLTPFALYGIYKAYQVFARPKDIKAVLDRLPHETEQLTHKAIEQVCSPVNKN